MKKVVRLLGVVAGLTMVTAIGGSHACADTGDGGAPAREQYQGQKQRDHHRHHRKHHRHRDCNRCCCDREERRSEWRHERFAELADRLRLSDRQETRLKEVFRKNRPEGRTIVTNLIQEKRELRDLVRFGNADETAIRAEAAKVAKLQADLAVNRAQMFKQLRAILTPEQIDKFKTIQQERDARIDRFRERMAERGDEPAPKL